MVIDPSDLYPDNTKAPDVETDAIIALAFEVRLVVGVFVLLVAILLLALSFGVAR